MASIWTLVSLITLVSPTAFSLAIGTGILLTTGTFFKTGVGTGTALVTGTLS